jgi:CheY-like chemotaxis protein
MNHPEMGSTNALPRGTADVPPAASPLLDGLRVLVVDDEARFREMLGELMGCCGAAVTAVGSVAEALRMMPEVRPDVLLSDLSMPERDGYALIRAVRGPGPRAGRACAGRGGDHYLAKPVDLHRLVATIGGMTTKGVTW